MDGKVVLITGGNAGLGLESTKRLVEAGATVIFTSRDATKGNKAIEEVYSYLKEIKKTPDDYYNDGETSPFMGKAFVANLDLCDIENIKSFNNRLSTIIGKETKIDVLMNNAGVMAIPTRQLTKDGYEQTFQTNHLGHFVLTSLLLPRLQHNARVINVSSMAYQFAAKDGLEIDNLNGERNYGPWSSYGQSKLANILFTNEMQARALQSKEWSNLRIVSLHPGAVQTDLARYIIGEEKFNTMKANGGQYTSWTDKLLMEGLAKFVKTVQEGASTQIYLSSVIDDEVLRPGGYYSDGKVMQVLPFAHDEGKAKELWTISEKLSGVKFSL
jgi:NAD(P)-dependent dehydrogenase (short-subunit alcohol dehydrogenase family)